MRRPGEVSQATPSTDAATSEASNSPAARSWTCQLAPIALTQTAAAAAGAGYWAFVIGAAIGGLSGALFAGQVGFVNNQKFDVPTSVLFLAAVVLGGSGNKVGVIVGAFLVSYIPNRFIELAGYKYLIFGVALIVLMAFRPQGLLGARQRLLAYGRQAYQRLVGKPEQLASDNPMTTEPGPNPTGGGTP